MELEGKGKQITMAGLVWILNALVVAMLVNNAECIWDSAMEVTRQTGDNSSLKRKVDGRNEVEIPGG